MSSEPTEEIIILECGHFSNQTELCKRDRCPPYDTDAYLEDLEVDPEKLKEDIAAHKAAAKAPPRVDPQPTSEVKRNYTQEFMGIVEQFSIALAASVQDLRHEMEKEYNLDTLTTDLENESG